MVKRIGILGGPGSDFSGAADIVTRAGHTPVHLQELLGVLPVEAAEKIDGALIANSKGVGTIMFQRPGSVLSALKSQGKKVILLTNTHEYVPPEFDGVVDAVWIWETVKSLK